MECKMMNAKCKIVVFPAEIIRMKLLSAGREYRPGKSRGGGAKDIAMVTIPSIAQWCNDDRPAMHVLSAATRRLFCTQLNAVVADALLVEDLEKLLRGHVRPLLTGDVQHDGTALHHDGAVA